MPASPPSSRRARLTRPAICAQRLSRWHADVDNAFKGWNGAWLDPDFRKWDITEFLAYIRVPLLIVQGEDDQYGTVKQIEIAQQECYCPVEVALLPGAKHSPQRDAPEATLKAIADFVARVLRARRARLNSDVIARAGGRSSSPVSQFENVGVVSTGCPAFAGHDSLNYSAACLAALPCAEIR